jgi:putative FmdB family regulatory protein
MPLYEYICQDCGQQFEKVVRLSELAVAPTCPVCGSSETQKQLSLFAARGASESSRSIPSSSSCASSSPFR